jgi:hypothetical protein
MQMRIGKVGKLGREGRHEDGSGDLAVWVPEDLRLQMFSRAAQILLPECTAGFPLSNFWRQCCGWGAWRVGQQREEGLPYHAVRISLATSLCIAQHLFPPPPASQSSTSGWGRYPDTCISPHTRWPLMLLAPCVCWPPLRTPVFHASLAESQPD